MECRDIFSLQIIGARTQKNIRFRMELGETHAEIHRQLAVAAEHADTDISAGTEIEHSMPFAMLCHQVGMEVAFIVDGKARKQRSCDRIGLLVVQSLAAIGAAVQRRRRKYPIGAFGSEGDFSFAADAIARKMLAGHQRSLFVVGARFAGDEGRSERLLSTVDTFQLASKFDPY